MFKKIIRGYKITKQIGNGTYGTVYKVEKDNSTYVLKQIPFGGSNKEQIVQIKNEAKILSSLHSNYVVKYYESFEEENFLYIVMEFCEGGDLGTYLLKNNKVSLNEDLIWKIFIQISLGLYYIHGQKVLHRDLKTLNIFLTKNFDVKIGDLGVAKALQNTNFANTFIGTPYYLSPEICEEKPYNEKSDIWALGCILYEMATFKHPFEAQNQAALLLKILNGKYEPLPLKVSAEIKDMVKFLLDKNCFKRPNINGVIEHPIFVDKVKKCDMINEVISVIGEEKWESIKSPKKIIKKVKMPMQMKNMRYFGSEKKLNLRVSSGKKSTANMKFSGNVFSHNIISNSGRNSSNNNSKNQFNFISPVLAGIPKTPVKNNGGVKKAVSTSNYNTNDISSSHKKELSSNQGSQSRIIRTKTPQKAEKVEKADRTEKTEKIEKNEKIEKAEKTEKTEEMLDLNLFKNLLSQKAEENIITVADILEDKTDITEYSNENEVSKKDESSDEIKMSPAEQEEQNRLKEEYKKKYDEYYNEIKPYNKEINVDKIFEMYHEMENQGDINDDAVNKIEDFIKRAIPEKAKNFITAFYGLIFYELRYNNI